MSDRSAQRLNVFEWKAGVDLHVKPGAAPVRVWRKGYPVGARKRRQFVQIIQVQLRPDGIDSWLGEILEQWADAAAGVE
ncbi:MAG: hypothetical protein IT160_15150 [Bryobacterales bacterium]|nr:hypothetical protein [Bryobacterales bacterium]